MRGGEIFSGAWIAGEGIVGKSMAGGAMAVLFLSISGRDAEDVGVNINGVGELGGAVFILVEGKVRSSVGPLT